MPKRYYLNHSTIVVADKTVSYINDFAQLFETRLHADGSFRYCDGRIYNINNLTEATLFWR